MNRIARFFGADEEWERPALSHAERVNDVRLALGWFLVAALCLELIRSADWLDTAEVGIGGQYALLATASALLVWRRTYPLAVALTAAAHMVLAGTIAQTVMGSLPMQVLYFFAIYSGVAWARDRRATLYAVMALVLMMGAWLIWLFSLGSGAADLGSDELQAASRTGIFPPLVAAVGYIFMNNALFFGGAVVLGQVAWRGARRTAQTVEQADTIARQSARLRDQAVVAERLRIARELHDVVAHHVSVMGVQAAAARRVLASDPDAARDALTAVEQASRDAVGQMHDLLGALRSGELAAMAPDDGTPGAGVGVADAAARHRAPQPRLHDLPALIEQGSTPGVHVDLDVVESRPGAADAVPPPVQLSAYRVVQEALANVRRHSSAQHASVVVRVGAEDVEVEVVDDGRPRRGTSGTGLGQRGIRERAEQLGGTAELGPRAGRDGYRVRVRFPVSGLRHRDDLRTTTDLVATDLVATDASGRA